MGLGKKDAVKPIYHEATLEEEQQQQEQDRSQSQKGEVDRIVTIYWTNNSTMAEATRRV